MEHKPVSELAGIADVQPTPIQPLSRRERLDRWAELLERDPDRVVSSLEEIEWKPKCEWARLRADNSALSVAFADPVLREEGLASDRLGDAMGFFELSGRQAHLILCSCLGGRTVVAGEVARRIRGVRAPRLWSLYTVICSWTGLRPRAH